VIEDVSQLWEVEERWLAEHFGKSYCYNAGRSPDAPMRGRTGETSPNFGRTWSGDVRDQISATLKDFYAQDYFNHPRAGKTHTEETKAKISAKVQQAVAEGRGGAFIPSDETRKKMSESLKGNQNALGCKRTEAEREAILQRTLGNQNFLGKKHTEEAKEKMRRPIYAVLPDGTRRDFVGVSAAGKELGVAYPMLVRSMKAQKPIAKGKLAGWLFAYVDLDPATPVC
jgi:hypothetical protein